MRRVARDQGLLERVPDRLGERELTRQNDLARLVRLAEEFGEGTVAEFLADLESRFGEVSSGRGVNLLTYHRAKGLEFDLVVLVDPDTFGNGIEGAVDRYVAMTRATQQLVILRSS